MSVEPALPCCHPVCKFWVATLPLHTHTHTHTLCCTQRSICQHFDNDTLALTPPAPARPHTRARARTHTHTHSLPIPSTLCKQLQHHRWPQHRQRGDHGGDFPSPAQHLDSGAILGHVLHPLPSPRQAK